MDYRAPRRPFRIGILALMAVGPWLPAATVRADFDSIYSRPVQMERYPRGVAVTDLDDDGNLDLVAAVGSIEAVVVFFGNGDGILQPAVHYPVAETSQPTWPAIGDFNEDGRDDVVVTHLYGNPTHTAFSILIGAADGTLEPETAYGPGYANAVVIGDFDEDDHQDLVTVRHDGASLFRGYGDGTFAPDLSIAGGGSGTDAVLADFNGDGHDDFAVPEEVMLGNGDLTFSSVSTGVTGDFYGMAAADLNDDEILDLVLVGSAGDGGVLLGNGDGSFVQSHTWPDQMFSIAVIVMDQNQDGAQDLVLHNDTNLMVVYGNGNGQFADPVDFPTGAETPFSISAGDFDNDGRDDLGLPSHGSHSMGIILRDDDGALDLPSFDDGGGEGRYDLNGDGRYDRLTLDTGNPVSARLANGAGTFGPTVTSPLCVPHGGGDRFYAVGELTGDGIPDLALISESDIVFFCAGDGTGLFEPVGFEDVGAEIVIYLGTADLDEDEVDDVVVGYWSGTNYFVVSILSGGEPPFGWPRIPVPCCAYFDLPRLDADEHIDLVLSDTSSFEVTIHLGNGDGTFGAPSAPINGLVDVVGDVNGDSVVDLLLKTNPWTAETMLMIGNGDGTFTPGQILPGVGGVYSIADLDLDGHLDLAADQGCIVFGVENGYFGPCEYFPIGRVSSDFNLDGRIDKLEAGVTPVFNRSGPDAPTFAANRQTLIWPAELGAWSYNVYSGPLSSLVDLDDDGLPDGGYGSCISGSDEEPRDTFLVDTQIPTPGEGFFYLIGVVDAQGEHGLGTTSGGLSRVPGSPCP